MKRRDYMVSLIIGVIVGLYLANSVLQTMSSTDGFALSQIEDQITKYKVINSELMVEIDECSSLINIEKQATLMGFIPATDSNYYFLKGGVK